MSNMGKISGLKTMLVPAPIAKRFIVMVFPLRTAIDNLSENFPVSLRKTEILRDIDVFASISPDHGLTSQTDVVLH